MCTHKKTIQSIEAKNGCWYLDLNQNGRYTVSRYGYRVKTFDNEIIGRMYLYNRTNFPVTTQEWNNIAKEYAFNLQYANVTRYVNAVNDGERNFPTDNRYLCETLSLRNRALKMGAEYAGHVQYLTLCVGVLSNHLTIENR